MNKANSGGPIASSSLPWVPKSSFSQGLVRTFLAALVVVVCAGPVWSEPAIVINEIHCNPDDETELVEFLELHNAGAADVDLSGWYFDAGLTYVFPSGTVLAAGDYLLVAEAPEHIAAKWNSGRRSLDMDRVFGPYEGRLSNEGERIALCDADGQLVDEVEYGLGFPWPTVGDPVPLETSGTGASMQLANPTFDNSVGVCWVSASPTLLEINGEVYSHNMHPFVRDVSHEPQRPKSSDAVTVTVKVTDVDGVAAVGLEYQVVPAGRYIPGPFSSATDWTAVLMSDEGTEGDVVAGDDIYTAVIPAQPHRTLVRYRFLAMDPLGAATSAPYADDAALNFAYFVYDGVPDYEEFSAEMLQTLPVHHLLTRADDMYEALGYNSANQIPQFSGAGSNPDRFDYKWYGTFVYDGVVYDNIRYRLRGANGRYLGGNSKRSMRFRFNRGHYFQAKDADGKPYPTQWRTLTTAKGFDNRLTLTYALNEHVNFYLYNKMGVPAPYSYYFHFRVIDEADEAPDPWRGDFWGLGFAQETYDSEFLDAHGLAKGNLYKLINSTTDAKQQQRYQAPNAVTDGSDHDTIQHHLSGSSTPEFIRSHVRLDKWYTYHALAQAIRHYDYWPSANKNATWYFEPVYTPENDYLGLMWTLPWDTDASWGPTWNNGEDVVYNSIFRSGSGDSRSNPELQPDYFSAVREVRDLLWQPDQIELLLAEMAAPITEFIEADRRRWLNAPYDAGNYNGLSGAGKSGLAALIEDMKDFAFEGGSWPGGNVSSGGRAAFLDQLVDEADGDLVPDRPTIVYVGDANYPADGLRFLTSAFSDPQGDQSFGAMKWRIAEVSPNARVSSGSDQTSFSLIAASSPWRYFKGTAEPSTVAGAWRTPGFDDNAWLVGQAPIGYGETFIATRLDDMQGGYSTVYLRKSFNVADLDAFDSLELEVWHDDGVNVWINGTLVFQDNMASAEMRYDETAESATENTDFIAHALTNASDYLMEGTNIIAVQVANASLSSSSDCFIDVRLTGHVDPVDDGTPSDGTVGGQGHYEIESLWESEVLSQFDDAVRIPGSVVEVGRTYRVRCRMRDNAGYWSHWSAPVQFEVGSPSTEGTAAGLRITELMYNPGDGLDDLGLDNDEFEFIELKNVGDEILDLSQVVFTEGVTFAFGDSAITTLAPGQFLLVVRNRDAFVQRYGTDVAALVAGQYEGKLANEGETVKLVDFWSGTVAEFEYRDEPGWPQLADGEGYSLVPLDTATPGGLNDGANWRASMDVGGSPGRDDL